MEERYVLGHGKRELERLTLQAHYFAEPSMRLLRTAGIEPGCRVLDLGCGVGDLSLLAAELVGPTGAVVGIDRSSDAIAAARQRLPATAVHVSFVTGDVETLAPTPPFDALVGRFVLMHQPDPVRVLRQALPHLRPGGIVAFLESHLDGSLPGLHSSPHCPLYDRACGWILEVLRRTGVDTAMGLKLPAIFVEAGLPRPDGFLSARVEGGAGALTYRYMAESVRSLLPLMTRHGVTTGEEIDVETLEERLRDEAVHLGATLTSHLVVGAWTRLGTRDPG